MNAVPEGWREIARLSPFNALVGPLFQRSAGEVLSIGLRIEEKHANSRGICHGGVLATLADLARIGDWIESEVRIQRIGARLAFADCYLLADGVRIVRASAIFARSEKE